MPRGHPTPLRSARRATFVAALCAVSALCLPALGRAQLTVQGRVSDEGGRPVAGAQVSVEGTTAGTVAGDDGTYRLTLTAPRAPVTLVARFIGFRPQRATLQQTEGAVTQDFTLPRDVLQLSEVVTTGSRVATERSQLGATLSTVGGDQLAHAATPQIDVALAGKVPGALVTQSSGTPGGGTSVRIRGLSTLSRSAEPLYIVDGVIVDNSSTQLVDLGGYTTNRLADLDPNDIERIEIVKGAAAAALYGSRANDGVVQIFTKRGRPGALQATVRSTVGFDEVEHFVPVNQALVNAAGQPIERRYDYQEEIFRKAQQYSTSVQLSGGDERTRYFLSGALTDQQGVIFGTDYQRKNVRLNLDRDLTSWLRVAASTSYIDSDASLTPNGGLVSNFGVLTNFLFTSNDVSLFRDPVTGEFPRGQFQSNPLEVIANWRAPQEVNRYIAGIQLSATPLRSVTVDYRVGYDAYTENAGLFVPRNSSAPAFQPGIAVSATNRARLTNSDLDVSWTAQLSPRYRFTTSAGMNWQQQRFDQTTARAENLPVFTDVVNGTTQFGLQVRDDRRTLGFYGQEQVGIADALFLTAALRSDASSAFGAEERTQYFPKLGASLDVSALAPARGVLDVARVGRLRLRAAFGQSGGQPAGSFDRFDNYVFEPSGAFAGTVNSTRLGNPQLKPERQKEFELGADVELFGGRLGVEYTYFDKQVDDLILPRTIRPSSGYLEELANVGQLVNYGAELLVRSVNWEGRRFGWTTSLTLATNHPRVTRVTEGGAFFIPETFGIVRVAANEAPGHFFGTTYVRNADGQILNAAGVPIVNDQGQVVGVPAVGPRRIIGDPNPRRYWSVANEFTLGSQLSFRVQVDGVEDFDVFNFDRRVLETPGFGAGAEFAKQLTGEVPTGYFAARRSVFEEYIEDGSFVKLRELSASY
ncbi:MAG TPA: TonB-dependent receptor, partial [Gemmatimonadaceae bacterium]|nr:TonB-dependent receptor [Gemmatimonadaceae bacterium]